MPSLNSTHHHAFDYLFDSQKKPYVFSVHNPSSLLDQSGTLRVEPGWAENDTRPAIPNITIAFVLMFCAFPGLFSALAERDHVIHG